MNYKLHYEKLISKAQNRSILKSEYKEIHHIIPKCIGGTDNKTNLVALFPEEHIIAHLLLTKIHPDNYKLLRASNGMTNGFNKSGKVSNKKYAWLKEKYSEKLSKEILANPIHLRPGVLQKLSNYWKINNPMFKEQNKIKTSIRMRKSNPMFLDKHKQALSERMKNNKPSADTLAKKSVTMKDWHKNNTHPNQGKSASLKTKEKLREAAKKRTSPPRSKEYNLINPDGNIIICIGNLTKTVEYLNLSLMALKNKLGQIVIIENNKRRNTEKRANTVGWSLIEIVN